MHHICFTPSPDTTFKTAILIRNSALKEAALRKHYIDPINLDLDSTIAFSLEYSSAGKCPVSIAKPYIDKLLKALGNLQVEDILVCDPHYFKFLTGARKADPNYGYVLPCKYKGYEHMNIVLCANYNGLFYNPTSQAKIDMALYTLSSHQSGNYVALGTGIVHSAQYPDTVQGVADALKELHKYATLTCDVETFSLKHYESGIGTCAFAWDKHNGIAFACDYEEIPLSAGEYGKQIVNHAIRALLLDFLQQYGGNLIFHNATFDVKILIYNLWMDSITDHVGLIDGLEVMTDGFDCTKVIRYLATNTTAGNKLSLKEAAHAFAGNYAENDIKDIRRIPLPRLLEYNLVDCLATWYVYKKEYPTMMADKQEELYLGLMKHTLKTLIQMELTGMPMSMERTLNLEAYLKAEITEFTSKIMNSGVVAETVEALRKIELDRDFKSRRDKAVHPDKIKPKLLENISWDFNPGSGKQLIVLLYEVMKLPILSKTKKGAPSTGAEEIEFLINHTDNEEYIVVLDNLIQYNRATKILSTFVKSFLAAPLGDDGIHYLFGSFNLGGTVSGRLSASDPNLQTIPSNSKYAKRVKECFVAVLGWIFCGADFASLEDYISALTTRDPNKLKVYTDKFEGHCLRAFTYFPERLPGVVDTVDSINSIKGDFPDVRQDSKPVTFLLTYDGTYHGLMKNMGFSETQAKAIENNYRKLYWVSELWKKAKIMQACKDGYVTVAFGLRVRTPLLAQTVINTSSTPYEAQGESRTAGNALGQSYGLLNCRAANEFMDRVRASKYRYDIKISAQIHDAIYLLIKDSIEVVHWVNNNLTECMAWQELPELQHDEVKLSAELDLFYDGWNQPITLPNHCSKTEILRLAKAGVDKYDNSGK